MGFTLQHPQNWGFFADCHKIQCFVTANQYFSVAQYDKPACSCSFPLQFHSGGKLNVVPCGILVGFCRPAVSKVKIGLIDSSLTGQLLAVLHCF